MASAPIFIVGAKRSGTTLLRELLRSHPHLAFEHETHFLPRFYRAYGDPRNDREARALARRILNLGWIRAWGLDLDPAALEHHRSFAGLVAALYARMAAEAGKRRWGDKTPDYAFEIPLLHELFPDAKIVHIYRDGRDVALSWLRAGTGPRNVYTAAEVWRRFVTTGRGAGASLPASSYKEVRYESLLSAPEETMRDLCRFLEEPFCEDVLRPAPQPLLGLRFSMLGKPQHPPPPSREQIVGSNAGKWRIAMRRTDRALFESVAGDLLEELGYEVEGLARRVPPGERFAWRLHHRARRVGFRLNNRPWPRTFALMLEASIRERLRSASRKTA